MHVIRRFLQYTVEGRILGNIFVDGEMEDKALDFQRLNKFIIQLDYFSKGPHYFVSIFGR